MSIYNTKENNNKIPLHSEGEEGSVLPSSSTPSKSNRNPQKSIMQSGGEHQFRSQNVIPGAVHFLYIIIIVIVIMVTIREY